jgi:ELWxxDGT repeat protein
MLPAFNGSFTFARRLVKVCGAAALAMSFAANAATPQLVRNINDAIIPQSSFPRELGELNGKLLFSAGFGTRSLLSTDGTAAGTVVLKQFNDIIDSTGNGRIFAKLGGRAYFAADDGVTGFELWSTDGTSAGTTLVKDLRPGADGGFPDFRGVFGNRLVFATRDSGTSDGNLQMYITDGTAAGTQALTAFDGTNANVDDTSFIADDRFYFVAHDNQFQRSIWVSDGTPAGTHALPSPGVLFSLSGIRLYQRLGNVVLFAADGGLWKLDPATDAIDKVTWNHPQLGPQQVGSNGEPIVLGSFAMFITGGNAFASLELWRTDSTTLGTFKVGDIHPGPAPFDASQFPVFRKVGDRVVYIADDGVHGPQLWGSDGTAQNTVRLTDVTKPANVSHQVAIAVGSFGDTGYFMLPDGANTMDWSMWRTDGTVAGTRRIAGLPSIDQGTAAGGRIVGDAAQVFITLFDEPTSSLWKFEPALDRVTALRPQLRYFGGDLYFYDGQRLYFGDNDRVIGNEPWVSDGTAAGTHLIVDIILQGTADNGSAPNELVEFGGRAVFAADDGVSGRELWMSDGTDTGTTRIADINPGFGSSEPNHLAVANGALYFFATDDSGASKFMRLSSLTGQPEALAVAVPPFAQQFLPYVCRQDAPVAFGGNVYFAAQGTVGSLQLWKSDGTAAGTGPVSSNTNEGFLPCDVTVFGNRLYFSASSASTGTELWTSDGTSAGTAMLADVVPGTGSSEPLGLTVFNGALYFTAHDDQGNAQLWKSNGNGPGTTLVARIGTVPFVTAVIRGVVNNKLLLETFDPSAPVGFLMLHELWTSGGSAADTSLLKTISSDFNVDMVTNGARAYFGANDSNGYEPWISDGTVAGTQLLKDLNASGNSNPSWFADFRGVTLFAVNDQTNGPQLWRTDGTSAGTTRLADIAAPPTDFFERPVVLRQRATVGQKFFFVATDAEIGDELYVLVNESPVAGADSGSSTNSAAVTINVLTNDSDSDGTLVPQSVRIAANPAHGTVSVNANGALVYTPAAGFSGSDAFAYTVDDNQGATSNASTVTVSVTAATVVTTGKRSGGGPMSAVGLLALSALLMLRMGARLRRRASSPTRS